jgi:hypothetical protein
MAIYDAFSQLFSALAGEQLKMLLETKHLYQRVSIEPNAIITKLIESVAQNHQHVVRSEIQKDMQEQITVTDNPTFTGANTLQLWLPVKNVKLFCIKCAAREAFRPIWYSDITVQLAAKHRTQRALGMESFKLQFPKNFQLLALVFLCQRCELLPTAVIVKRVGLDLFLEGRSPIEHIELPKFIPKEEQKWFRDGVIAFQTGKVLAALFYLRTFIEQFARRKTGTLGDKKTGDEILSAYAETIPENLRSTMPSLREMYDKLSEALHGAIEDAELFECARGKIEEHFDIRRVHRLDTRAVDELLRVAEESGADTKKD